MKAFQNWIRQPERDRRSRLGLTTDEWHEDIFVARCTVARLVRDMGLVGVVRGRNCQPRMADANGDLSPDLVKRTFTATRPHQL